MDSRQIQTFQWSFNNASIHPDSSRPSNDGAPHGTRIISATTPPSTTSSVSYRKLVTSCSSSSSHKPYSTSTLWDPKTDESENRLKCFLTLTPQLYKPLSSSLPLISFAPAKREQKPSQPKESSSSLGDTKPEQSVTPKMKFITPAPELPGLRVPSMQMNLLGRQTFKEDRRRPHPRAAKSVVEISGPGQMTYITKIPKLPKLDVSPRSDFSTFNPSSVFTSPKSHKTNTSGQAPTSAPRDADKPGKVWTMPNLSPSTAVWPSGIDDQNELDSGTLYSKKQSAFYSRISREHTVVPPPSNCNRFLYDSVSNADYVTEKRYVKDNYHDKQTRLQRIAKDEVVFPGVYKSHLRKSKDKKSYLRSMIATEEKRSQFSQISCIRCHRSLQTTNKELSSENTLDENNNLMDNIEDDIDKQPEFPRKRRSKEASSTAAEMWKVREDLEENPSNNSREAKLSYDVKARLARERGEAAWQDPHSFQFCDVLGKRTCRRCREFYSRRYQRRVEETLTKENEFRTQTPPTTPEEAEVTLPTQALHKVVIRVKDKQGVMAITAVGVNEDAVTGL